MSSGIVGTSDLSNYTICSLPQSRETIPLSVKFFSGTLKNIVNAQAHKYTCFQSWEYSLYDAVPYAIVTVMIKKKNSCVY
jgi:hypothetical protein